jgi:hypothetical protein
VVWLPPERTTTGTPMLTRNFDFSPWTLHQFLGWMRRTLTAHAVSELAVIGWRFANYWLPIPVTAAASLSLRLPCRADPHAPPGAPGTCGTGEAGVTEPSHELERPVSAGP